MNDSPSQSKRSIILDIETLALTPDALITQIGMIAITGDNASVVGEELIVPGFFQQLSLFRRICPETIKFHEENGTLPATLSQEKPEVSIIKMEAFIQKHQPRHIWIQGPDFDRPIIEDLCIQLNRKLPWNYWITRDSRTLQGIAFPGVKNPKRPHDAIGDCLATRESILAAAHELGRFDFI